MYGYSDGTKISTGHAHIGKRTIGTVVRFPHRRDAEKIVNSLRNNINVEFKVPKTVAELITHYREQELTREKKAYATIEVNSHDLPDHIVPG